MVATVQNGTAKYAAIPGVVVAGKTGTAESGRTNPDGSEVPPYAWFVGFAPAAPAASAKVAVAVMIQHIDRPTNEIAGGTLGGPIIGATLVMLLKNYASAYVERWNMLLGFVFLFIVLVMPTGILPGVRKLVLRLRGGSR